MRRPHYLSAILAVTSGSLPPGLRVVAARLRKAAIAHVVAAFDESGGRLRGSNDRPGAAQLLEIAPQRLLELLAEHDDLHAAVSKARDRHGFVARGGRPKKPS